MRISGGTAKGVRLEVPKGIRPSSERVRQAVMTSLGPAVEGARVLDLYCGSGAWGLEALSRGADSAVLVDSSAAAAAACRANAEAAGMSDHIEVVRQDAAAYLQRQAARQGPFDLVFSDPPYRHGPPSSGVLDALASLLGPDGVVVWETGRHGGGLKAPQGWLVAARRYGDTQVTMLRRERT